MLILFMIVVFGGEIEVLMLVGCVLFLVLEGM